MSRKRETHLEAEETQAKRQLEDLRRRWPSDPKVILVFLVIALLIVLLLWL